MSALTVHRSLGGRLRSELYHNICMLSLRRPMLEELCRMLTGGPQALDKLNQSLLIHLSYYLVTIIDPKLAQLIAWPLYDKSSERTYKTQLLSFLSTFYNKTGSVEKDKWITPIQSSYLNAGGFKVMQLLFEMSQLALSRLIRTDFKVSGERLESCDMSLCIRDKVKLDQALAKSRRQFTDKSIKFIAYKKKAQSTSEYYKKVIIDLEKENEILQNSLQQCVAGFDSTNQLKDVNADSVFLTEWNDAGDDALKELEEKWLHGTQSIVTVATNCRQAGKSTVARSTLVDKTSYLVEYVPGRDNVHVQHLEMEVSSQQRYILKNIVKDNVLSFPNLLRGYTISVCFLFKNLRCVELVEPLNDHVGMLNEACTQLVDKGKWLIDGMHTLELKFKKTSHSSFFEDSPPEVTIPPLPDIKIRDEPWQQSLFQKPFTPLQPSKLQFNIKNGNTAEFRQPRSMFLAPTHTMSRQSIFKNIAKLHAENLLTSFSSNTSTSSQPKEMNKTTADCSAGFTKDQVQRLLSSRKSSIKKTKPHIGSHGKARRSCLFKDTPEHSFAMERSLSSPNLVISSEYKKKSLAGFRMRSLYAITQEQSPERSVEMSGIACLQSSTNSLPQDTTMSDRNEFKNLPAIVVHKVDSFRDSSLDSIVAVSDPEPLTSDPTINNVAVNPEPGYRTPNSRNVPSEKKKTNSIEKLIEKYKRIRNNSSKVEQKVEQPSFKLSPITDLSLTNKENNLNEINVDITIAGRLPDLVSPSCTSLVKKSASEADWSVQDSPPIKDKYKCRESLGAALGVDNTFLDQFELIE